MARIAAEMTGLVLVTGATGYVGSVLVPVLAGNGWRIRALDTETFGNSISQTPNVEFIKGSIMDYGLLPSVMKGVSHVIHLAGIVTDELVDMNPVLAEQVNVQATGALLSEAKKAGVGRFIYASSSSVYGTQPEGVEATEETIPQPMTIYAETKLRAEKAVLYANSPSLVTTAVRSATCCGPAPRMRLDTIVNTFSAQAWFKGRITVHGGGQWRTNIHVRDIARLYASMLHWPVEAIGGQVFNAAKEAMRASDIAILVQRAVGKSRDGMSVEVLTDATRQDPRHYRMGGRVLWKQCGWFPILRIEDAVRDNVRFFKAGGIRDPDDAVYYNTRRMAGVVAQQQS